MTEKILLVDDEPSALEAYERLLHKDFQVTSASGPNQALVKMKDEGALRGGHLRYAHA
jgi:PleD family two-component response regulator